MVFIALSPPMSLKDNRFSKFLSLHDIIVSKSAQDFLSSTNTSIFLKGSSPKISFAYQLGHCFIHVMLLSSFSLTNIFESMSECSIIVGECVVRIYCRFFNLEYLYKSSSIFF